MAVLELADQLDVVRERGMRTTLRSLTGATGCRQSHLLRCRNSEGEAGSCGAGGDRHTTISLQAL